MVSGVVSPLLDHNEMLHSISLRSSITLLHIVVQKVQENIMELIGDSDVLDLKKKNIPLFA